MEDVLSVEHEQHRRATRRFVRRVHAHMALLSQAGHLKRPQQVDDVLSHECGLPPSMGPIFEAGRAVTSPRLHERGPRRFPPWVSAATEMEPEQRKCLNVEPSMERERPGMSGEQGKA